MRAHWKWLGVFGVWTALALSSVAQTMLYLHDAGRQVQTGMLVLGRFADWYTCALFTPLFVWLVRRYPADRLHWRRSLPVLVAGTVVAVALKYTIFVPLRAALMPGAEPMTIWRAIRSNFLFEAMIFGVVIAILHALELSRRGQERDRQTAALRAELSEARLDALASQLHPHFLFNTLNAIAALMHRDVRAAEEMLTNLSELLRGSLERDVDRARTGRSPHELPLSEELGLLDRYLAIMRARFGPRLTIEVDVDPAAAEVLVPRFILQPLVENALQHGAARHAGSARVGVRAAVLDTSLELTVENDGPPAVESRTKRKGGVGLSNTRRRLYALYGDAARFDAEPLPAGGFRARLVVPIRPTARAGATRAQTPAQANGEGRFDDAAVVG